MKRRSRIVVPCPVCGARVTRLYLVREFCKGAMAVGRVVMTPACRSCHTARTQGSGIKEKQ